jgi:protein-disulfide isomerase
VQRFSIILLSLFAVNCGSAGNPQLETDVARLRIEVDELKAKSADSEKTNSGSFGDGHREPTRTGSSEGAAPNEDLAREVRELRLDKERLEQQLAERPAARPSRPQRPRPKPESVYALEVVDAPFEGAKNAKVTVIKNFEFACPFCQKNIPVLEQLLKDYKGDIKVVYKHFVVHPQSATEPAHAACAAGMQGKFPKMATLIWDKAYSTRNFSRQHIEKLAKKAKLRMKQFRTDRDGACVARVQLDHAQAAAVGTTGTPSFYINGRFLSGARPIDQFKTLIDEELGKANARIRGGEANVANYYERFVLDRGLKKLESP